jgi:MFS family permease
LTFGILFFLNINQNEEKTQKEKGNEQRSVGFTPQWQQALFALALSTASGGFLFGAMSFLLPRYFEVHMQSISTNVAVTGILAGIVYACASFAQVAIGWLIDRVSPRLVMFWISLGQVIFIYLASQFENLSLFFLSIAAMCFVFGQIPITDTILVRYVPDHWRSRILSAKFLLNLCIGASVLPITSQLLKAGYDLKTVFTFASVIAIGVVFSSIILPKQTKELNPNI